jgi:hypothetical protein
MATHAWRVETSRAQEGSPDKFITRIHVSSDSLSTWNALTPVWNTENRIRRYRAWVLDNSFNKENPAPNKTIQMSSQIHNVPGNSPFPNEPSFTLYSCSNRWCPATFVAYHDFDIASGVAKALGLVIRSSWAGAAHPDDNNFYLVVDSALDSFGSLPYPMAHSTGTVAPGSDELLTITRVTNGPVLDLSQEFSLRVAGLLPEGDWDHYAQRKANDQSEPADKRFWPLFTLWADDNNYIEFRADCVNKGFEIRAQLNGTTYTRDFGDGYQLWLPNSQFYALISFKPIVSIPPGPAPATSYQYNFYFGASLGGGPVALASSPITVTTSPSPLGATFSQLRFRGGPDAIPNNAEKDNEVVTMRWVGGDFQTGSGSSYTTSTTIKSAFSDDTLAWVKGP